MARLATLGPVLLLAVALVTPADVLAQTKDDTIVYALQSDMQNWDPPNSVLRESIIMGYNVFDHLAARDLKTGKVGPSLALSWKSLDDTTWEVKLRSGVKFHDGTPFGAKDVKASFDRVLNPENKLTARGNHAKIKSVEVVDDLTVRFKTDGPYPVFVERLTALVMQSEKVIKEKGHEWMQENPVGTGPYKLVKWNKKQEHILVRNEDYWGPKPAFKYVRVRIIPEQATQIAELVSGGVDIIKAVPPDQMDVINKSGQARTTTSPILRTAFIQLDQAGRSGPNPFQDKRVRQAANLAVDMDSIIKHVLNGLGRSHRHHGEPDGLRLRSQREAVQAGPGPVQEAAGRRRLPERARGRVPAHPADRRAGADPDLRRDRGRSGQGRLPHQGRAWSARSGRSRTWFATARPSRCSSGRGATTRSSTPTPSSST